jgi:glutamate formiminotransferase
VGVLESEIVGLIPQAALLAAAEYYLQLDSGVASGLVLENRLRDTATPTT